MSIPRKPSRIFDRDAEWDAISGFAAAARAGPALAIVRGRRRHGKSILLREACAVTGGFYYQAIEGTAREQLDDFARGYAAFLGHAATPSFAGWQQAIDAVLSIPGTAPRAVVIDEFSYLTAASPGLPSIVQRALDSAGGRGPRIRLVLCGSALSVMGALLTGRAPLRGRASVEVVVRELGLGETVRFAGLGRSPRTAIAVHAVCGGVPGYYVDLLGGDVPVARGDFDEWMVRGPLSLTRPLLYEARHLLADEPGVRDTALYLSVLSAIASGCATLGQIAARLERPPSALAHPLNVLTDLGLCRRHEDLLRRRRPTWHIADPLLRFYAAVMRPHWARLEQGRPHVVWRDAQAAWRSQVLGPHVEELAVSWAETHAEALVEEPARVGRAVVNEPSARTTHQLDIVGVSVRRPRRVVLLGEAKHATTPMRPDELDRLEHIRQVLTRAGFDATGARLMLISVGGFARSLAERARGRRVELVDAGRLCANRG